MKSKNKVVGITLGDPGGIGPEVIAAALRRPALRLPGVHYCLIGDEAVYRQYSTRLPRHCSFHDVGRLSLSQWCPGKSTRQGAQASLDYLETAVSLLKAKRLQALVTAPVCKESIIQIHPKFTGHTEYLAEAFGVPEVGMLFVAGPLRSIIVTRHIPLKSVSRAVTIDNVYGTLMMTAKALRQMFKIAHPRLAVCGLNPHAGEGGTMGREEIDTIIPAMKKARRHRVQVEGPFAADTLFMPKALKAFDVVVAMYHDQGLIPVKTMAFSELVNVTINLPMLRTSPAHGTAFNIVGKGLADPGSMIAAIRLVGQLV